MKKSCYLNKKLQTSVETALCTVFFGIGYLAWRREVHCFGCGETSYYPKILDLEKYIKNILMHAPSNET